MAQTGIEPLPTKGVSRGGLLEKSRVVTTDQAAQPLVNTAALHKIHSTLPSRIFASWNEWGPGCGS